MNQKKAALIVLLLHLLALVIFHIYGYIGHYGYDDMTYAELANDLTNGKIDYTNHFTYRFSIVFLTALSYSLFGISDFASSFPSMLLSCSILLIIFFILKDKSTLTLTIGLSLTAFSNWFLFYSDKLMPAIYVAFSVLLVLFIIYRFKYNSSKKHSFIYSLLLVFALLFGLLSKGVIVLIIPLLLYLIVFDFFKKRDIRFWLYTVINGILVLTLYFTLIWIVTGDFLNRFDAIAKNSYLNLCSYSQQSSDILLERVAFGFFDLLSREGMLTGYIFVFAFLFRKNISSYLKLGNYFSFFLVSSIILFLSSNFMTISVSSYSPMCLDPRHYLFLLPVAAIPASLIVTDYIKDKQNAFTIILFLSIISILTVFVQGSPLWKNYLPLAILFSIYLFVKGGRYQWVFTVLFVLVLLIEPIDMIIYAQKVQYWKQKKIAAKYALNEKQYIITNEVQSRIGNYLNGFKKKGNVIFLHYDNFDIDTLDNRKKILFLNWYTRYLSNYNHHDLPYYAKVIDSSNTLIFQNEDIGISIYNLNTISIPSAKENTILHSFNDFEQDVPFWRQNDNYIVKDIRFKGTKSNKINAFSATFYYPLDSIPISEMDQIMIACKVYCYFPNKTKVQLVISIEDTSEIYIYEGLPVNKYIKAYSNWWPVEFNIVKNANEIKEASFLKVYMWNIDKETAYIDNFEIKLFDINR